jgi:hypothetical protein
MAFWNHAAYECQSRSSSISPLAVPFDMRPSPLAVNISDRSFQPLSLMRVVGATGVDRATPTSST